jgi:hypothetical protein
MKLFLKYLFSLLIIAFVAACTKDFITKNITKETVNIIAPADNLTTSNNTITFWWDEIDGAEKYNLQIVKPSFSAIQQLVVDTNITGTKFNHTFTPGTYQWRIRATNNAGSTAYITRTIVIDTTSNLANVSVASLLPNTNYLTGSKTINFSWSALNAADYYEILVKDAAGSIIVNTNSITATSYSYAFTNTSDVVYNWSVKAFNSSGFSQYNTARTFTIDITAPPVSSVLFPAYGAVNVSGINDSLKWTRASTDTKSDSIVISLDSNFTSYLTRAKVYGTKLKISSLSPPLTAPSPSGNNYYWWRIISIDSVRNMSAASNRYKFKLN